MSLIAYRTPTNGAVSTPFSGWDREFSRWLDHANQFANDIEGGQSWRPSADIVETQTGFEIELDLPGVNPADVDLTVEDGTLTIAGERQGRELDDNSRATRIERRTGSFKRAFSLPDTADVDAIEANAEHGVLRVQIGKLEQAAPRKIRVQVQSPALDNDTTE